MAQKTKFSLVREIQNAYEIKIRTDRPFVGMEEELDAILDMLFFQTRAHIQIDLSNIRYFPISFTTKLLRMAQELRLKKRVLVLIGLPLPTYAYLRRFGLDKLLFPAESILRKKDLNPME